MNDTDQKLLIKTLKSVLKKRSIKYRDIALGINLSEVSIKRIFSNYDCTLSRLSQICEFINISLLELSEITLKQQKKQNYFLSPAQEEYFSKSPFSFYLFRELYRGKKVEDLLESYSLEKVYLTKVLLELDKLELINYYEDNRIKILVKGIIRPNINGPFFQKIIKNQNNNFLESVYNDIQNPNCCFQSSELKLSKRSYTEMISEMNHLGKKYREKSFQESKTNPNENLEDIRWLFALLPYKTQWENYRTKKDT